MLVVQRSRASCASTRSCASRGCCRSIQRACRPSRRTHFQHRCQFPTNTNWQNYGGERRSATSHRWWASPSQNFVSAATGIARGVALIRAFVRDFRQDRRQLLGRPHPLHALRAQPPLSIVARACSSSGRACRRFSGAYVDATTLEGAKQVRQPAGPAASQIAIKQARHQWRRLLERELRGPLTRTRPTAQQFPPECLPSSLICCRAHPHLRAHGQG